MPVRDQVSQQLLDAGLNAHILDGVLTTETDRQNALELLDAGMPVSDLARLVTRVPLGLALDAIDDGVPPRLVSAIVIRNGTDSLAITRQAAILDPLLPERLVAACSNIAQDIEDLELAGCDLSDVAWLLERNVPLLWVGRLTRAVSSSSGVDTGAVLADLPALTRRIAVAFALCDSVDALAMLPAAVASAGQPWAETAVTLAVEHGKTWQAIVTARALESDPHLPDTDALRWPTLPLLESANRIGSLPLQLQQEHVAALAAGADADLLEVLGDDAASLGTEWPESVAWSRPRSEWLAAALSNGGAQRLVDLARAAEVGGLLSTHAMGSYVAPLACGVSDTQVADWLPKGLDIGCAAMLTGYGFGEADVERLTNTPAAWHLLDLMAVGASVGEALAMLPTLAGLGYRSVHGRTWGPPAVTAADLGCLQAAGGVLESDTVSALQATAGSRVPDGLLRITLLLSCRAHDRWDLPVAGAMALSAAAVGRDLLPDGILAAPVPEGTDVAVHLAEELERHTQRDRHLARGVQVTAAARARERLLGADRLV